MLHSQQREMQLMRKAIVDLQSQIRQLNKSNDGNKINDLCSYENGVDTDSSFNFELSNVDSLTTLPTAIDTSSMLGTSYQQRPHKQASNISKNKYQDNLQR